MARIDLAWELGAHTGHVTTLMPIARALKSRGHDVRFLLKDEQAGSDLAGIEDFPREGAPNWVGPPVFPDPLNLGEILHNFGYHDAAVLKQLVDAWRERLWLSHLVLGSFAPAAMLAARTLGIPGFELSQGFYVPPMTMPAPPLRDWEPVSRARLEESDGRVVSAINEVFRAYGVDPIATIGHVFAGRAMLLTYPEIDVYPQRGPADYYGVPESGEGKAVPPWPSGRGPKVFAYVYNYYQGLPRLVASLAALGAPTLMLCRNAHASVKLAAQGTSVHISEEPMAVSRLLPQCDLVVCHGSHQMTAQALLAGKPMLLVPTQLEQFLTTRRVVRFGAGLGIAPEAFDADFSAALARLASDASYARKAGEFAARYRSHSPAQALASMVRRCEEAISQAAQAAENSAGQESAAKAES